MKSKRKPPNDAVEVRSYYPRPLVKRVDELAAKLRQASGMKVSRPALLRAIAQLHLCELVPFPEGIDLVVVLANLTRQDPIQRGRKRKQLPLPLPFVAAGGADPELPRSQQSPRPQSTAEGP